jgi:hypothetical protein
MSSLSAKDRASLCQFTFADGRRCRTPRVRNHPHFCFAHAKKEAKVRATESLGKDLAYFFSGDYLSACALSTALARLIPAVVRGDVKPRTARTVAYLAQTLLQTIHISQHEYCEAFGPDTWRKSIRNSVKGNHTYRFPPAPKPEQVRDQAPHVVAGLVYPEPRRETGPGKAPQPSQPQPQSAQGPLNCHSERSEESASSSNSSLATHHSPLPQSPAPSSHTPLPPTSAEFAQHVAAGLKTGSLAATPHVQPAPPNLPPAPSSTPPKATPSSPSAPLTTPAAQPHNPPQVVSSTPKHTPPPDSRALHFDHNCRLLIDGKPF